MTAATKRENLHSSKFMEMNSLRSTSLSAQDSPGPIARWAGKCLTLGYKVLGFHNYDNYRIERFSGLTILVLPSVANPKILRSGAFFVDCLSQMPALLDGNVLDLGTGSGACAIFMAKRAEHVVATDLNPTSIRCARINALINGVEKTIDVRHGDLFTPVVDERFDLILFNPPFYVGEPRNTKDLAWRSETAPKRFAKELAGHLKPNGSCLLLLSSLGDACGRFEQDLCDAGFNLEVFAKRRYLNEVLTVLRVTPDWSRLPHQPIQNTASTGKLPTSPTK